MNHATTTTTTRTTIRLVILVIASALMITITIFLPNIQQQKSYSTTTNTRHEVKALEQRSAASQQHLNEENLCLRTGKCSNANVGEQTLGNDNSVTGFTDQSKNVQARVVVTPPTATPSPTPTPTLPEGRLVIHKLCSPSCEGVTFAITVTVNNRIQPSSFTLGDSGSQMVTFDTGTYTVTESPVAGFFTAFGGDCKRTGPNSATGTIGTSDRPEIIRECDIFNIATNNLLSQTQELLHKQRQ